MLANKSLGKAAPSLQRKAMPLRGIASARVAPFRAAVPAGENNCRLEAIQAQMVQ